MLHPFAAACTCTPPEIVAQLVGIVDAGVSRPLSRAIPGSAAGLRFGQLCLRKLYVLAARGAEASQPQGCLLQVPALLLRQRLCPVFSLIKIRIILDQSQRPAAMPLAAPRCDTVEIERRDRMQVCTCMPMEETS